MPSLLSFIDEHNDPLRSAAPEGAGGGFLDPNYWYYGLELHTFDDRSHLILMLFLSTEDGPVPSCDARLILQDRFNQTLESHVVTFGTTEQMQEELRDELIALGCLPSLADQPKALGMLHYLNAVHQALDDEVEFVCEWVPRSASADRGKPPAGKVDQSAAPTPKLPCLSTILD